MSDESSTAATPPSSANAKTVNSVTSVRRSSLLQQHLGLMLTGLLTLLLAVKVLVAGNYDSETALGILQVAGTSSVLVATLVSVLPYLLIATFFLSFNLWGERLFSLTSGEKTALFSALAPLTSIFLFVMPLVLVGIVVAFLLSILAIRHHQTSRRQSTKQPGKFRQWRMRRRLQKPKSNAVESERARTPESPLESAASQASAFTLALLMAAISPWMPSEAVTVGHDDPVKAQVIGERGDETIFLPDGPTQGLVVAETSAVSREYCDNRSWASVTAFQVFREPAYAKCPE